jgi:hypothetical protein
MTTVDKCLKQLARKNITARTSSISIFTAFNASSVGSIFFLIRRDTKNVTHYRVVVTFVRSDLKKPRGVVGGVKGGETKQ